MKKKKATSTSSPKSQTNGNSRNAQQQRVLNALRAAGGQGLSTIQLRETFDVMMPASRIHELRHEQGYNIHLVWDRDRTAQGRDHLCGRYILLSGKWRVRA